MANKQFVKLVKHLSEDITLRVYAGMCVAISEYCENLEPDDIMQICELSEAIWQQVSDKKIDIYKWCEECSGVNLRQFLVSER